MGQANDNVMMRKNRGMVGGQVVYRVRGGKSIVSNAPKKREPGSATADQLEVQKKFTKAVRYGKKVNANPALQEMYKAAAIGGQTAYNVAVADAFKAPEVVDINTTAYTGAPNQVIVIDAIDNFKVKEVTVVIVDGNGITIEQGNAVESEDTLDWLYTTTQQNNNLAGSRIAAIAIDFPGNQHLLEKILE